MTGSVEVSIVIWSRYITLKLLWRTLENDVIKGPLLHIVHQPFYKKFVISVFWNKYSPFVPIFIMAEGILYFYLRKNYAGYLPQSWKFFKYGATNKIQKLTDITLNLDLILTGSFFKNLYFTLETFYFIFYF